MMMRVLTSKPRLTGALLLAAFVLAVGSVWIRHGLDFTDDGFRLSQQQMFLWDSPYLDVSPVWLSDAIGATWLWLSGDKGLLSTRVGGLLISLLTALVSFWVLTRRRGVLPVLLPMAFTASLYAGGSVIGYVSVSALFCIAATGLLLEGYDRSPGGKAIIYCTLGGVMLAFATLAKITLITSLILLPILHLATKPRPDTVGSKRRGARARWAAMGFATGCLIGMGVLAAMDRLEEYGQTLTGIATGTSIFSNESHTGDALIVAYLRQAPEFFAWCGMWAAAGLAALGGLTRKGGRRPIYLVWIGATLMALLGSGMFLAWGKNVVRQQGIAIPALALTMLACGYAAERWLKTPDSRSPGSMRLFAASFTVPFVVAVGSATGVETMQAAMWLALPAACLAALRAAELIAGRLSLSPIKIGVGGKVGLGVGALLLTLIVIAGRGLSPYRDARNIWDRTSTPAHKRLQGIYTTSARALVVEQLLLEMAARVGPRAPILVYNGAPMLYYLTRTQPVLGQPWTVVLPRAVLDQRLSELGDTRPMPVVAVKVLTNTRDRRWGSSRLPIPFDHGGKVTAIDVALEELGYITVWSNEDFAILARPQVSEGSSLGN